MLVNLYNIDYQLYYYYIVKYCKRVFDAR